MLAITALSAMADFSGIAPLYIFFRSMRSGVYGKALKWRLLKEAVIASCIAAAIGIGVIPGATSSTQQQFSPIIEPTTLDDLVCSISINVVVQHRCSCCTPL